MGHQIAGDVATRSPRGGLRGWDVFPEGLSTFDAFQHDAQGIRERFDAYAGRALDGKVVVDVLDVQEKGGLGAESNSFFDEEEVASHLKASSPDLRIIALFRKHSLAPLLITKALLQKTLYHHAISCNFLDLLYSFRTDDDLSEKGQSLWSPLRMAGAGYELCYQMRYMERNSHRHGQKWSERQFGVYHHFGGGKKSAMILINAGMTTKAQTRLQETLSDERNAQNAVARPLSLHLLLISSYIDNWRPYLEELGQWCLKRENRFLTVGLNHPSLSFKELQELRNFESQLLSVIVLLKSTMSVISELEACGLSMSNARDDMNQTSNRLAEHVLAAPDVPEMLALRVFRQKCLGFHRSVEVLQSRTQAIMLLVSDGLNQQSQQTANSIADSSHALTLKSLHDSYVVKVVTVITVVYLPLQGVATFFGMNVTDLNERTNRFHFADNWWLFLTTAIPITFLTLGILGIAMRLEKRRKLNEPVALLQRA